MFLIFLSPLGRTDRYQKNLWRYYVEHERNGELAYEIRSDNSRSLTMLWTLKIMVNFRIIVTPCLQGQKAWLSLTVMSPLRPNGDG